MSIIFENGSDVFSCDSTNCNVSQIIEKHPDAPPVTPMPMDWMEFVRPSDTPPGLRRHRCPDHHSFLPDDAKTIQLMTEGSFRQDVILLAELQELQIILGQQSSTSAFVNAEDQPDVNHSTRVAVLLESQWIVGWLDRHNRTFVPDEEDIGLLKKALETASLATPGA